MKADRFISRKLRGRFVVFDGPDGCGKTTQLQLLADVLTSAGQTVVKAHDPGGTVIGERIRQVLLGYDLSEMDVRCETFLFMASRAQLVSEVIGPALKGGATVLCSRFISATYAYQGAAGYDTGKLFELGRWAVGDVWPDVTVVLDVPAETGFERTGRKSKHAGKNRDSRVGDHPMLISGAEVDAMEARPIDYHRRVREGFLSLPGVYPRPVVIVDGGGEAEVVHGRVLEALGGVAV